MTRKDYNLIASIIAYDMDDRDARVKAARAFARVLQRLNPRFDPRRFWDACCRINEYWNDGQIWDKPTD